MARNSNIKPNPIIDTLEFFELNHNSNQKYPNDLGFAKQFLKQYNGNISTFNCYRKEVERFLQWAWLIQDISILDIRREHIESYLQFCEKPPKSWIGTKVVARFHTIEGQRKPNPEWRPFISKIPKSETKQGNSPNINNFSFSQKSIREIFVALGSLYQFLLTEGICNINPVASIRQKSKYIQKNQTSKRVPRLSEEQWKAVLDSTQQVALENPGKHERSLFIISSLYLMYLRISELASSKRWQPQMNHFFTDSYGHWWFTTVGKGNKERTIAVSDAMLEALKRWRKSLGCLTELPTADDNSPLVLQLNRKSAVSSTKTIHNIVQFCFNQAIDDLNSQQKTEEALSLNTATAHWLRHTGISDDINKRERPIIHVRDDAGHSNVATTDRYNDVVLLERHRTAKDKSMDDEI